ncbi:hypothetical protein P0F65_09680 [Sphingomonas sp. I4]
MFSGDQRLATSTSFRADGETHVALDIPTQRVGFLPLRVELDGRGGFQTLAAVQEPRRLLYIGERQRGAAGQLQQLLGPSFVVDQRAPSALSQGLDPARWPLVMVDDLPASRLPVAAQQSLNRAVTRGEPDCSSRAEWRRSGRGLCRHGPWCGATGHRTRAGQAGPAQRRAGHRHRQFGFDAGRPARACQAGRASDGAQAERQ